MVRTSPRAVRAKYTQNGVGHGLVVVSKAARRGPMYGLRTMHAAHIPIFRARSWKKNMSWMNMRPPDCATVEKKPLRMRAAMKDSKLVAAAHHAAVMVAKTRNQKTTGRRPK